MILLKGAHITEQTVKKVEFLTNRVYNEYNKTILYLLVGQYARNNNEKAL